MTTLRRELRTKFEEILQAFEDKLSIAEREAAAELLADAAIELRGIAILAQPLSIENAIAANQPITEEMVYQAQLRDVAPKMFEHALGFSKPLPWWNSKDWTVLGEWVCDLYSKNKTIFGEFNIWRNTPYTKGGISNTRLRGFPNEFYDSWDMFMMSRKPKTDEAHPEYQPFPFQENQP